MAIHHKLLRTYLRRAEKVSLNDVATARKLFERISRSPFKPRVRSVENIKLDDPHGVALRIYSNVKVRPLGGTPVIMYFHGGGFMLGSLDSHDGVCRYLARTSGCDVVSVGYRLAPEYRHPSPIEDGVHAFRWLKRHANARGWDTSRIFLAGDSAGGNIALSVTLALKDHSLKGLILIYPALDPRLLTTTMEQYASGYFLTKNMLREFWGQYLQDADYRWPLGPAELALLPSTLVIAAEKDVLHDEGRHLVEQLHSLGKPAEHIAYKDMLHGFMQFPHIVSRKRLAYQRIATFIADNGKPISGASHK